MLPGLLAAVMLVSSASADSDRRPLKVLFIGNSFTSANDLPGMFADISRSKDAPLDETAMIGEGDQGFGEHAKDPVTRQRVDETRWDVVVVHNQSRRPSLDPKQTEREVFAHGKALVEMIRKVNPRTRVVFIETWARKRGDKSDYTMQHVLSATYAELARRNGAEVAFAGTAWTRARRKRTTLELYADDGIYPSAQGSYLAACVVYQQIFFKSAAGAAPAGGVTNDEAAELQNFAEK